MKKFRRQSDIIATAPLRDPSVWMFLTPSLTTFFAYDRIIKLLWKVIFVAKLTTVYRDDGQTVEVCGALRLS